MNWNFFSSKETPKLEVQWSPAHYNKFITWGNKICVYEVGPVEETTKQTCFQVSEDTTAQLLGTNTQHQNITCIDVHPKPQPDVLLAVGLANGRVVLKTGPTGQDLLELMGKELIPENARKCNAVAWNSIYSNLVVCGLRRSRSNNSILLWDVLGSPEVQDSKSESIQPLAQAGLSDTTHSLSWFNKLPKCLVAGVNNKHLNIFDFRDPVKVVKSTPTKAVNSVAVNPHNIYHIISHFDNQINIWDTRYFEKPLLTLLQDKNIVKVLWCPARQNFLGSLQENSNSLRLYDIQHCDGGIDHTEPSFLERSIPLSVRNATSFSWHSSQANRFLAISVGELIDHKFCDRVTLNWSTRSQLTWNNFSRALKFVKSSDSIYETFDDVADLTKKRAVSGYGLLPELAANGELAENDMLKNLWQWLCLSRSLTEDGTIQSTENKHPGVKTVLKLDDQTNNGFTPSKLVHEHWKHFGSDSETAKVYKSADRDRALQLCGWKFEGDESLVENQTLLLNSPLLEKLEKEEAYTRVIAILVFSLRLKQAVKFLQREAKKATEGERYDWMAGILTGFSLGRNEYWEESCLKLNLTLTDPYFKAILAFLTTDDDSYEYILNEKELEVEDRVAFALKYLPDTRLIQYLNTLTSELMEKGDLRCFFLTGASLHGIQLLEKYFEITGDVQSCCLIAIRALSPNLILSNLIQTWIESYRALLDAWKLWMQRAHFDIAMGNSTKYKPPSQVYISCNYCGESISGLGRPSSKPKSPLGSFGSTSDKQRTSSCPHCQKPLPRCAICLQHMGSTSGSVTSDSSNSDGNDEDGKLTGFGSWFTWCQTCRHGGHTGHITHWFEQHTECPVTPCRCKCFSLDPLHSIGVKVT